MQELSFTFDIVRRGYNEFVFNSIPEIRREDEEIYIFLGCVEGNKYDMYFTIQTWTERFLRYSLEFESKWSRTPQNIKLHVDVVSKKKSLCLKPQLYERSFSRIETYARVNVGFVFGLHEKLTSFRLHGYILVSEISGIGSSLELGEQLMSSSMQNEIGGETGQSLNALNKLSEDLEWFLKDITTSDVALKCASDTLHAHKLILSARSPVFQAMFKNEMLVKNPTGVVNIDDISAETVRTLLCYMYSGKVEKFTTSTACEGLYASEKYQVPEMKQACIAFLKRSMSNDDALIVLKFADLYDKELKEYVIDYICTNFRTIKKSESWNNFENDSPSLAFVVLRKVVDLLQK